MSDADCTEARWSLPTEWLYKLALTHRARAQYALTWHKWPTDLENSSVSYLADADSVASDTPNTPHSLPPDTPKTADSSYSMEARNRACVRYAMRWRPTFLAVVALSYEILIGCKAAGVLHMTVARQRKADPDLEAMNPKPLTNASNEALVDSK